MSFNEVKNLRKNGKLQEALELAKADLEYNSNDIWNKRSIGWVYYELLKLAQTHNNLNEFIIQLRNIKELELPNTELMIFDSCAWSIGKLLFANNEVNPVYLNDVFDAIKDFEFSKPKESYSFLFKAVKKHSVNWTEFLDFVDWWGLDNFMPSDYENFVLDNGSKIPSLAEGVYISISKQLLQSKDIAKIKEFLPTIANASANYNNMQYPPFYYAKLLLVLGDKEKFIDAFLPFAKRKQRDFWVWDLMGDIYAKDSNEYYSCLCKSLSCRAPDKFTGGVREKLAEVFLVKQMYAEAKYEYQQIIKSRQKEGWALRDKHHGWQNFAWWNDTKENNNRKLYMQNSDIAQSLLFANVEEEIIVIERVNKEKSVFNFIVSKEKNGFASYRKYRLKPQIGDVYAVRFEDKKDEKSNFYNILSITKTEKKPSDKIYKEVSGKLQIREGNSFGFVGNTIVLPQIIKENKLKNNDTINAKALISYNKKKKSWGWSVNVLK